MWNHTPRVLGSVNLIGGSSEGAASRAPTKEKATVAATATATATAFKSIRFYRLEVEFFHA
jgi:hypothetical protein